MGWKIVRDRQREYCETHGVSGTWRISPSVTRALTKKLFEEAAEFAEYYDPAELYDLRDVLDALLEIADPTRFYEVKHADKVELMGKFSLGLEWTPDPRANYQ